MSTSSTSSYSSTSNQCPTHKSAPFPRTCPICVAWGELDKERQRLTLNQQQLDVDVQLFKTEKINHRRKTFLQADQLKKQQEQQQEELAQQQLAQREAQEQLARERAQQQEQLAQQVALRAQEEEQEQQLMRFQKAAEESEKELQRKWEKTVKQLKIQYETEIEQWKLKYQKEQEDNRIQILEWKLKFQKQDADIQQGQQDALEYKGELQQLQIQYQDLLQKQQQHERELPLQQLALEQEREADRAKHLEEVQLQLQKQQRINADQQEAAARQNDELNSLRDQVMRMNNLLAQSSSNRERSEEDMRELQEKLEDAMIENDRYATLIDELKNKCKALEEQRGHGVQNHRQPLSDDEDDDVYGNEAIGKRDCPHCEDLEEDLYELKLKLNKLQISSQKEIEGLKEQLDKKMTTSAATPVGADHLNEKVGTSKTGLEQRTVRKSETEKKKGNMKMLAFAAKEEFSKRERRALEQELEEANRNTHLLALELEQLHNERDQEREEAAAKGLDHEQLVDLMRQIDQLQQSHDAYGARHKVNAQEWNELTESLSQRQRQVFETVLPQMDDTIQELEQHIKGLEKLELPSGQLSAATANNVDNSVAQSSGRREAPLAEVDSNNNRRVLDFNYKSEKFQGKYTGFVNTTNQPEGHGVLLVKNQDVYEGEWKNGKLHGQGVYASYDGDLYAGLWFEGEHHGQGVSVFSDGQLFVGEYNMGRLEGQGITVWHRGDKYKGSYANDMRNGPGELLYSDGRVYRGDYVDDRRHGYGVETSRDGKVLYDGFWAYGEFVGDGGDTGSVVASIADPGE